MSHSAAVLSMHVRVKLVTGRIKRDEESARTANASMSIVDCDHRSITRVVM